MEWMKKNIFKKVKDEKKLNHLSHLASQIQTKDELIYKLEEASIETLKRAVEFSKDWTPGNHIPTLLLTN